MSAEKQRDQALSILHLNLAKLSKLYKESYLSMGRGALLVYATDIIDSGTPRKGNYRTKEEMLEIFDAPTSKVISPLAQLAEFRSPKRGRTAPVVACDAL